MAHGLADRRPRFAPPPGDPAFGLGRGTRRGRDPRGTRRRHVRRGVAAPASPDRHRARHGAARGKAAAVPCRPAHAGTGREGPRSDVERRAVPTQTQRRAGRRPAWTPSRRPPIQAPAPPPPRRIVMNALELPHVLDRSIVIHARPTTVFRYFTDTPRWAAWW